MDEYLSVRNFKANSKKFYANKRHIIAVCL